MTMPLRTSRSAVNSVLPCAVLLTFPSLAGSTRQWKDPRTGFRCTSVATATKVLFPRARTGPDSGPTVILASGPGVTVTACVPLNDPAADAVIVWVPARVSR